MKNLYLDIDGVLLTKQGAVALHLVDFLDFATRNFNCYWLTTHCKGDAATAVFHLSDRVPSEALPFLEKIKPTYWELWKTEGIDFSQDFFWLDDYAFDGEKNALRDRQTLDKLITVDLRSNPDQLLDIINTWRKRNT